MKLRALLVDDEDLGRLALRQVLENEPEIELIGEAINGLDALEKVQELCPDVVFLDIEMPGLNGFEVVSQSGYSGAVVFVTAYDEYAVRAFDANAIDYVLKPVRPERLRTALSRVRERLAAGQEQPRLSEFATSRTGPAKRLAVRRGKRIVIVPLSDVVRIEIEDKLVFAFTATEKMLVEKTISQLEAMLEPAGFIRINRGELVNQEMVRELVPWFSGTWRVKLAGGEERDVSRERAKTLKESMGVE